MEPTIPSKSPSSAPTETPSNPTETPTSDPTKIPTEDTAAPTIAPTANKRLDLVCTYTDGNEYDALEIKYLISTGDYAKLLKDVMLSALAFFLGQSVNYNESESSLAAWDRGGITDFVICYVFDTEMTNLGVRCPYGRQYEWIEFDDDDEYYAIGRFRIVADGNVSLYEERVVDIMTSRNFTEKCTENMNNTLKHRVSYFSMSSCDIFDPDDETTMPPTSYETTSITSTDITSTVIETTAAPTPEPTIYTRKNRDIDTSDAVLIHTMIILCTITVLSFCFAD